MTGVLYGAIHLFRIRWSHVRDMWRTYPPLWTAAPLGLLLAVVTDAVRLAIYSDPGVPFWRGLIFLGQVLVALVLAGWLHQKLRSHPEEISEPAESVGTPKSAQDPALTWIHTGEAPIESADLDLFEHEVVAKRIARSVTDRGEDGSGSSRRGPFLALLGGFGTGKTSIVKLALRQLPDPPRVIVARFDAWSAPRPEDIPRLALNCIVTALDPHIDTIELRTLPLTYRRMLAAEPTGWIQRLFGTGPATDSLEALERLNPVLDVLDARLLLIVEDVERAGERLDTRHLGRLLWALRRVERASFILAMDPQHTADPGGGGLDYLKFCDTIEMVPTVELEQVAKIFGNAYRYWRTELSAGDIDPVSDRRTGGKLQIPMDPTEIWQTSILRHFGETGFGAVVSILQTPRALRHTLRRVDRAWRCLHGEAELDDIIVLSALRHGAEPAYRFLLENENITATRIGPEKADSRSEKIRDEWNKLVEKLPRAAAVKVLGDSLGLTNWAGMRHVDRSLQDVTHDKPTDYFRRIITENIEASVRDQEVLHDIELWNKYGDASLVEKLVEVSTGSEQYARVWLHFSVMHSEDELRNLANQVVASVRERDGSPVSENHPAMMTLFHVFRTRFGPDAEAWLRELLARA